ncbi:hypothetical protein GCM10028808_10390 [Spirosoma migulaei]
MVQVVDYEEFSALKRVVEEIKEEYEFLQSLLLAVRWISRQQAMGALCCKGDKLRMLTRTNRLTYRYEGKKPYYDVFSIRAYLNSQKIDAKEINKRIIKARFGS